MRKTVASKEEGARSKEQGARSKEQGARSRDQERRSQYPAAAKATGDPEVCAIAGAAKR